MSEACCELDLEAKIIKHASPTLAGIKPANLFVSRNCACSGRGCGCHKLANQSFDEAFISQLQHCREVLEPFGVRIEVLAERKTGPLVYVYRPDAVSRALTTPRASAFLAQEGYNTSDLSSCINRLHKRICGTDLASQLTGVCSFPHEIGLFLGYPIDDVIGFIENKGENYLCQGCWKVYNNEKNAQECFCNYKRCTAHYEALYKEGVPIECLAAQEAGWSAAEAFQAAV